jgi:hypothetical protein
VNLDQIYAHLGKEVMPVFLMLNSKPAPVREHPIVAEVRDDQGHTSLMRCNGSSSPSSDSSATRPGEAKHRSEEEGKRPIEDAELRHRGGGYIQALGPRPNRRSPRQRAGGSSALRWLTDAQPIRHQDRGHSRHRQDPLPFQGQGQTREATEAPGQRGDRDQGEHARSHVPPMHVRGIRPTCGRHGTRPRQVRRLPPLHRPVPRHGDRHTQPGTAIDGR